MKYHLWRYGSLASVLVLTLLLLGASTAHAFGTVVLNFEGNSRTFFIPDRSLTPDMSGDVGLNYYIQATNHQIAAYDKETGALEDIQDLDFFFLDGLPAGGACTNEATLIGQPQVHFDQMSGRWFVSAVGYDDIDNGPYYQCIAMSNQVLPAPTGGAGVFLEPDADLYWNMYQIVINPNYLHDQPKFGIWHDGIYMAADLYDIFNNGLARTPKGVAVWVFNRDDLTSGAPTIRTQDFYISESFGYSALLPSNLLGAPPPAGTPNYFAAVAPPNKFLTWEFHTDWLNPTNTTFTGPKTTTVNNFTWPVGYLAGQNGSNEKLNIQGQRLMQPLQYRHYVNGNVQPTLWANHTVGNPNGTTGVRWYELRNPANPLVFQQGTFDNGGDTLFRWLGSLAVDREGNMALGYSRSNSTTRPAIYQTGRLANDPLGQLRPEMLLFQGTGFQNLSEVGTETDGPWGQYSHMTVDPYDQCNFWYTNQYYVTNDPTTWRTRIFKFSLTDCDVFNQGVITRVNLHTNGNQALGGGSGIYDVDISDNGRFVVFDSEATNLVNNDTNGLVDVFLRDRDADGNGILDEIGPGKVSTARISRGMGGAQTNGNSGVGVNGDLGGTTLSISGDGRFIAYSSVASNIVPNDNNGTWDVFVYDRVLDTTIRVSVNGSAEGNGVSDQPTVASVTTINGTFCRVAFRSFANNLDPAQPDTNNASDIFYYNCQTGVTSRISLDSSGGQGVGNSYTPSISANGRYIAFTSEADLEPGLDNNAPEPDVYRHDVATATTLQASVTTGALAGADDRAYSPSISAAGNLVVFASEATNLDTVLTDTNNVADIFLHNFAAITTTRISLDALGNEANGEAFHPTISADGTAVAFETFASNLLPGDTNGLRDIYHIDLTTGELRRVTFGFSGDGANGASFWPALGGTGQHVAFASNANNLVNNDTNNLRDVFAYDRDGVRPPGPLLLIPQGAIPAVLAGHTISIPVQFTDNNAAVNYISSVAFTLDLDNPCLLFDPTDANNDNIPDSVHFNLPTGFVGTATYVPAADHLDIAAYDPAAPLATLPDNSNIVSIDFQAKCQPPVGGSQFVTLSFANTPQASFGDNTGSSVAGKAQNGAVEILYNAGGDCNGDGRVDAGDLSALILEIFDGDGISPANVAGGTFKGNPSGCDPNSDNKVNAGDISCTILVIFNGLNGICTCLAGGAPDERPFGSHLTPAAAELSPQELLTRLGVPTNAQGTLLALGTAYAAEGSASVPLAFSPGDTAVNAIALSVDYDETLLSLDTSDTDGNGIPDAITLSAPAGYQAAVSIDTADKDGEIDIVLYSASPTAPPLKAGTLANIRFQAAPAPGLQTAAVRFSASVPPSLGNSAGQSTPLATLTPGVVLIGEAPNKLYVPFLVDSR